MPHFVSGDNNLIPLRLWWGEIIQKSEDVSEYFVTGCRPLSIVYWKYSYEQMRQTDQVRFVEASL